MLRKLISILLMLALAVTLPVAAFSTDEDEVVEPVVYVTLTYDFNGADKYPEPLTYNYEPGTTVTLYMQNPARIGYYFLGWMNINAGSVLHAGDTFVINDDTTLIAVWERDAREITEIRYPTKYEYDHRFNDALEGDWFYSNVVRSFELGLMNGVADDRFNPTGTVTTVEAVIMTARLHNLYYNGNEQFAAGAQWYTGGVQYAIDNRIVGIEIWEHLGENISRAQLLSTLSSALPDELFAEINSLPVGELSAWTGLPKGLFPDLDAGSIYAEPIYRLYQAGIVIGDDKGNIRMHDTITRSETVALLTRIADAELRIQVS